MDPNSLKGNPPLLDKLNPELGGKLVKAVADDMKRAKQAAEKKAEKKAKAEKKPRR